MKRFANIPFAIALALIVAAGIFVGPRFVDAQGVDGDAANAAAIEALATAVAANDDAVKSFATAISVHDVAVQAFATAVSANAESPAPQPTVEPTAEPTAAPPGPEPTPTVEPEPTAEPVTAQPCQLLLSDDGSSAIPVTKTGQWTADRECEYPVNLTRWLPNSPEGDRYYQYADFVVTRNDSGAWTATLESAEDTVLILWEVPDNAADPFIFIEVNDDMDNTTTNSSITWTPVVGKNYLLDLTTYEIEATGDFTLTITGGSSNAQADAQLDLMPADVSGDLRIERRQE